MEGGRFEFLEEFGAREFESTLVIKRVKPADLGTYEVNFFLILPIELILDSNCFF